MPSSQPGFSGTHRAAPDAELPGGTYYIGDAAGIVPPYGGVTDFAKRIAGMSLADKHDIPWCRIQNGVCKGIAIPARNEPEVQLEWADSKRRIALQTNAHGLACLAVIDMRLFFDARGVLYVPEGSGFLFARVSGSGIRINGRELEIGSLTLRVV